MSLALDGRLDRRDPKECPLNSPRAYLVTVVHNRRAVTESFARLLATQTWKDLTLVLVDDGSTDGTSEAVSALYDRTVVLRGNGALWWAGGLQKGLNWLAAQSLAPEDLVVFMNDDVSFSQDFFAKAFRELQSLARRAFLVVPGRLKHAGRYADEAVVCDWPRFQFLPYGDRPDQIDCATTRTLFMRWGDLRAVGGFHPTNLPHYVSDYEFTIRAHKKGIDLVPAQTVAAEFDDLTTGNHRTSGRSLTGKLKLLFSTRFSFNPLHMALFVWYSAPLVWKIPCWARIVISAMKFLRA